MIKVNSIIIEEFRGIRKLKLEPKGKNFAICGRNGTGKSGIVDALEFALTGGISRLSGEGTGGVSIKEHAPHVDSRDYPEKAKVILEISIPSISKEVSLERNVKTLNQATILPKDLEIKEILKEVSDHPEFVLSRRELIRYVVTTPGDRAKEVQILLRLDSIENLRSTLKKISNADQKEIPSLKRDRDQASEMLIRSLGIPRLTQEDVLRVVNEQRNILELKHIEKLTPTISLKDGLATELLASNQASISKPQALADIGKLKDIIREISGPEIKKLCDSVLEQFKKLGSDSSLMENVTREHFLKSALEMIDGDNCPVCDTPWKLEELKLTINNKLYRYDEVSRERVSIESDLEPLKVLLSDLRKNLQVVSQYSTASKTPIDLTSLTGLVENTKDFYNKIDNFVPIDKTVSALQECTKISKEVNDSISQIESAIISIPDPTKKGSARDFLTISQERLENYRDISSRLKRAEDRAELTKNIYDTYVNISTSRLDLIYKEVEKEFRDLYREINKEDEDQFEARLTPSMGKLGFDVNFYGRGFFPPGAYHSEGHQDSMGICLYLALMVHLLGDSFTFAVFDDVLMSVDTGHRREVCRMLKSRFPKTQFILTTHDEVWLRHMQTEGLVSATNCEHFRDWDVGNGPTTMNGREVWDEIDADLKNGDVRGAALTLRDYLEYISREVSHRLRAEVEFRGDSIYSLGDLLPKATSRFKDLLIKAEESSRLWDQKTEADLIATRKKDFGELVTKANVEQWQINPSIHYNEWANFSKEDFTPVASAYKSLVEALRCPTCRAFWYVVGQPKPETMKCDCGTSFNLKKK